MRKKINSLVAQMQAMLDNNVSGQISGGFLSVNDTVEITAGKSGVGPAPGGYDNFACQNQICPESNYGDCKNFIDCRPPQPPPAISVNDNQDVINIKISKKLWDKEN